MKTNRRPRDAGTPTLLPASPCVPRLPGRGPGVAAVSLAAVSLAACGTTRNFVDHPALTIVPPSASPRGAVEAIFSGNTPLYISLCNARRSSKECLPGDSGITARGVGGLFLPLRLHVRGIRVSAVHGISDGVGTTEVKALDDVTFAIPSNRFSIVIGASGSGKTTLLNLMGCIDAPTGTALRVRHVIEAPDASRGAAGCRSSHAPTLPTTGRGPKATSGSVGRWNFQSRPNLFWPRGAVSCRGAGSTRRTYFA